MSAPRRSAALATMLLFIVTLAGCAQSAKAHPNTAAAHGGPFTSLRAVRDAGLVTDLPAFDHTSADATAIGKLYDAIVALKPFPSGPIACPNDRGVLYHVIFTRADGTELTGIAKPDGCGYANLAGGTPGMIVDYDAFWSLFAAAVGVPIRVLQYQA